MPRERGDGELGIKDICIFAFIAKGVHLPGGVCFPKTYFYKTMSMLIATCMLYDDPCATFLCFYEDRFDDIYYMFVYNVLVL